jgi:UDP-perosamine 4-acetyltransferase
VSRPDKRVIVIGGGGHAKVALDVLRAAEWEPAGLLDPNPETGDLDGVRVLGGDELSDELFRQGYRNAFVAIGDNGLRRRLGARVRDIGFDLVTAIHPSAIVSRSAVVGRGVAIMPLAVVNAFARIGDLAIVNTGAIIEHDCIVGEAAHLAPRAVLGGQVTIGDGVFFGIGAVARPRSVVGSQAIVGAGAVVIGDVASGQTVIGTPARAFLKTSGSSPAADAPS